ncbi:MAG: GNAT family N-acetyltransferase [Pseudonocardia sp.]
MSTDAVAATVHRAWAADLDPGTLYALLRLRVEVFVVEQRCAYAELDGRDLEPRTRHYWLGAALGADARSAGASLGAPEPVLGCLRLLKEPDGGYRVGRLCVAREMRGRHLGRRLMDAVLAEVADGSCVLDAQVPQVEFYARYGFVPTGAAYDWDGIEHVPMRRARRERVAEFARSR